MMISPVGYTTYTYPAADVSAVGQTVGAVSKINGITPVGQKGSLNVSKISPSQCETCNNRKYVDGSNDSNVSFKTPTHISPSASFSAVSAHEQEHVSNAVSEGSQAGNKLISASVSLKMDVCPECGTPYVAGGMTRSQIQYNESNPYESARKSIEGSLLKGMNIDYVA
jgi:hypothetical protein